MTCETCQRQTTAVTIGTSQYCALCGSRIAAGSPSAAAAAPVTKPRSMDFTRGGSPVVSARGTTAHNLHRQTTVSPTRSLDLRRPVVTPKPRGTVHVPDEPAAVAAPPPPPVAAPAVVAAAPAVTASSQPVVAGHPRAPRQHGHEAPIMAARLERAKSVGKSEHISRFGKPESRLVQPEDQPQPTPRVPDTMIAPAAAITAHQTLAPLVPAAAPAQNDPKPGPKWQQYAGVAGAVAIMAGYVWLQNYPKLTIQAAATKAGVAATDPSYLPTSYTLASTSAEPGLLTLSFKSPSQASNLTIAQQRTTWDSKSLLDNYVAGADSNYSSIDGQGLTIYMFNNNQAAWVNHGIWYTIKGTARLSRDQVLKIAYGL